MSEAYIGVPFINQVSTTFPKEDFVGSNFGSITVGSTTYSYAVELSIDVPGSESGNIEVVLDNVRQEPDTAYTVHENSSSQPRILNFSETVPSSAVIYVIHKGVGPYNMTPPNNSITNVHLSDNLKTFTLDEFTGDGSTTDFTLSETPPSANTLLVVVDGIVQKPGASNNFTVSGNTIAFTSAPDASAEIEVKHLGIRSYVKRGPDFQLETFTGDGSTTEFTMNNTGVSTNNAFIFIQGVQQIPSDAYTINSSTGVITFTGAPSNGDKITVRYQL
jgi:hypothetical protein